MGQKWRAAGIVHQTRDANRRPLVGSYRLARYIYVCENRLILGGRRDPEDADDRATAERETREEIGLNLTQQNSIFCGGLDQRLLRTSGTTIPLMVLCPYGTLLQFCALI